MLRAEFEQLATETLLSQRIFDFLTPPSFLANDFRAMDFMEPADDFMNGARDVPAVDANDVEQHGLLLFALLLLLLSAPTLELDMLSHATL